MRYAVTGVVSGAYTMHDSPRSGVIPAGQTLKSAGLCTGHAQGEKETS